MLSCSYPGGRVLTRTYDELDRVITISDGGGTISTYDYTGPARIQRRDYGNGTRGQYTYDGITERLYVNGVEHPTTVVLAGNYSNWDASDKFSIGNEGSADRPWNGTVYLVAVYDRPLSPEEVTQNFDAGVGLQNQNQE